MGARTTDSEICVCAEYLITAAVREMIHEVAFLEKDSHCLPSGTSDGSANSCNRTNREITINARSAFSHHRMKLISVYLYADGGGVRILWNRQIYSYEICIDCVR